jgi:hypothetical protein
MPATPSRVWAAIQRAKANVDKANVDMANAR